MSPARLLAAIGRRTRAWLALRRARTSSVAALSVAPVRRVLVVCYGNIYRSPYAGAVLRAELGDSIEVRTVGFHAVAGRRSPERHVQMSAVLGVSLHEHRSAVVVAADLRWADIIVLMDRHNWSALAARGAEPHKLVWLGAFGDGAVEIADPYERSEQEAEAIVRQLHRASTGLARTLSASGSAAAAGPRTASGRDSPRA